MSYMTEAFLRHVRLSTAYRASQMRRLAAAGLLFAGPGAAALAHGGATGIVKERMDAMSDMSKAMKSTAGMMTGKAPYDAATVKANARVIKSKSGHTLTRLFPPNSLQMASEAKRGIWSDWQEFEMLADRLSLFAEGMALSADNGPAQMQTDGKGDMINSATMEQLSQNTAWFAKMPAADVFNALAKTCSACHEKFRQKKQ